MKQDLYNFSLRMGDTSWVLSHRLCELCSFGPSPGRPRGPTPTPPIQPTLGPTPAVVLFRSVVVLEMFQSDVVRVVFQSSVTFVVFQTVVAFVVFGSVGALWRLSCFSLLSNTL